MRTRRALFLVLVGCASPLTAAELRDGGADATDPSDAGGEAPPRFVELPSAAEASVPDAIDSNEIINSPDSPDRSTDAADDG